MSKRIKFKRTKNLEDNLKNYNAFDLNGYYPLFGSAYAAREVSPENDYHVHLINGQKYYMPNGLEMGKTQFHGDYPGGNKKFWSETQLPPTVSLFKDRLDIVYNPKLQPKINNKRSDFLLMKGKLNEFTSLNQVNNGVPIKPINDYEIYVRSQEEAQAAIEKVIRQTPRTCELDIVIGFPLSGMGGAADLPRFSGSSSYATLHYRFLQISAWAKTVLDDLAPLTSSAGSGNGPAQIGIVGYSGAPEIYPGQPPWQNNVGFPEPPTNNYAPYNWDPVYFTTASGKFLSTNIQELKDVIDSIDTLNLKGGQELAGLNCLTGGYYPTPAGVERVGFLPATHRHLNKAQTNPADCDLGDRSGQPGFKRVAIIAVTNNYPDDQADGASFFGDASQQAHVYRQTQDIYIHRFLPDTYHLFDAAGQPVWPLVDYEINAAPWTTSHQASRLPFAPYAGDKNSPITNNLFQLPGASGTGFMLNGGDVGAWVSPTLGPPAYGEFTSVTTYGEATNIAYIGPNGNLYGGGYAAKICPDESFDCTGAPNYNCFDPGTGLGQYATLAQCQAVCNPPTFDCDGLGNCYNPGTGNGQYATLADCENDCFPPTWSCSEANLGCLPNPLNTDPALYAPNVYFSLQDCEDDCLVERFICTGDRGGLLNCVSSFHQSGSAPSGPGIFNTLADCEDNCNQATWNCTPNGCVDPGDQTGQYFYEDECNEACLVYECVDGPLGHFCNPHMGGAAALLANPTWFDSLSDCQAVCYPETYNCVFDPGQVQQLPTYNCVDPLDGSGSFSSLVDCQNNCGPAIEPTLPGYDCDIDLGCVPHTGVGVGQYNTLADCIANCPSHNPTGPKSYDCSQNYPYQCYDPGTGLGQYTTLAACQAACIPKTYDCVNGLCVDPGNGLGQYISLPLCQIACSATQPKKSGPQYKKIKSIATSPQGIEYLSKEPKEVKLSGRDCSILVMNPNPVQGLGGQNHRRIHHYPDVSSMAGGLGTIIFDTETLHTNNHLNPPHLLDNSQVTAEIAKYGNKIYTTITDSPGTGLPGGVGNNSRFVELNYDPTTLSVTFSKQVFVPGLASGSYQIHCAMGVDRLGAYKRTGTYKVFDWIEINISGTTATFTTLFTVTLPGSSLTTVPTDSIYLPSSDTYIFSTWEQVFHYSSSGSLLGHIPNTGLSHALALFCHNGSPYIVDSIGVNTNFNKYVYKLNTNPLSIDPPLFITNGAGDAASNPECCDAPPTFNCTTSGCIDPGDGTGQYASLKDCNDACINYECVYTALPSPGMPGQSCVARIGPLPGGSTPYLPLNYYSTLADCQANCTGPADPPIDTPNVYSCVFDPGQAQQLPSYNCILNYIGPLPVIGTYSSLSDCQDNCGETPVLPTYDCTEFGCIDPGTGNGQYATLADCQAACKPVVPGNEIEELPTPPPASLPPTPTPTYTPPSTSSSGSSGGGGY